MNKVVDGAKVVGSYVFVAVGFVAVVVVTPIVSLVAVPIFAIKALPKWIEHRSLLNKTLTNLTREKFGRIAGQDYTRWDGKAVHLIKINLSQKDQMHELINSYVHGATNNSFNHNYNEEAPDCPFNTKEDVEWLNREFTRREKQDQLDSDLIMLRGFSKGLIPVLGIIWVLYSETNPGGSFEIGCRACAMGHDSKDTHWGWEKAINFQRTSLQRRLEIV